MKDLVEIFEETERRWLNGQLPSVEVDDEPEDEDGTLLGQTSDES